VKPVIVVKEGPRVVIGSVTLAGNQAIPADRLTPLLALKGGRRTTDPSSHAIATLCWSRISTPAMQRRTSP